MFSPPSRDSVDFPLFCLPDWPGQTQVEPDLGRVDLPPVSAVVSHASTDGSLAYGSSWLEVMTGHPDRLTVYEQFARGRPGPAGLTGEALVFARERAVQVVLTITEPQELAALNVAHQQTTAFTQSWSGREENWTATTWVLDGAAFPASILRWADAWTCVCLGPGDFLLLAWGHNVDPDGLTLDAVDFRNAYVSPSSDTAPETDWPWTEDHDRLGLHRLG